MKYDWSSITPPSSETVTIEPFGVSFDVPARWRAGAQQGDLVVLGSHSESGMMVAHAGLYQEFDPFFGAVSRFFASLGLAARATDGPRQKYLGSYQGITASYAGADAEGNEVVAHLRGLLSRDGIGAGVFGITAPGNSAEIVERVESVARTLYFGSFKPDRHLAEKLVGRWKRSTSGVVYQFNEDDSYQLSSGRGDEQGRYAAAAGRLILSSPKAGSSCFALRFHGRLMEIGEAEYLRME